MPANKNILSPSIMLLIGIGILAITLVAVLRPGTSRQLRTGADLQGSCLSEAGAYGPNLACEYLSEAACRTMTSQADPDRELFLGDARSRYFWLPRRRCTSTADERFFSGQGLSTENYATAIEQCEQDPFTGLGNAECASNESAGGVLVQSTLFDDAHGQLKEIRGAVPNSEYYVECLTVLLCSAPSPTPTTTTTPTPKSTNTSAPQNTP